MTLGEFKKLTAEVPDDTPLVIDYTRYMEVRSVEPGKAFYSTTTDQYFNARFHLEDKQRLYGDPKPVVLIG